jgi:hypothetical protein
VTVSASASDNAGVRQLRFYLNSALRCTASQESSQWRMQVPNTRLWKGTVALEAVDPAGNLAHASISIATPWSSSWIRAINDAPAQAALTHFNGQRVAALHPGFSGVQDPGHPPNGRFRCLHTGETNAAEPRKVIDMTSKAKPGAFKDWQAKQRELHSLEASLFQAARDRAGAPGQDTGADLSRRAQALREEVDRLFPSAMEELEESVGKLKDRRPRLHPR